MNLPNRPLVPGDISELDEEAASTLPELLQKALDEGDPRVRRTLRGLLLDRILRLLRQGDREALQEEAFLVSLLVSDATGDRLRAEDPETYGAFVYLQSLLSEAGRRTDRAAVAGLLRGTRGREILELLAAEGKPVQRSQIRSRLKLGEAQISHLLADLEEATLVERFRPEKGREVLVKLGSVGRELADAEILPAWTRILLDEIDSVRHGRPTPPETLARELHRAGAPSRTLAVRLADKLSTLRFPALAGAGELRDANMGREAGLLDLNPS